MARKSLRPQLNQIRAWARQGRTDAWIAHQLEVSTSELAEFRRQHGLTDAGDEETGEIDLRDEIEAEIEAAAEAEDVEEAEEAEEAADSEAAPETAGDEDEGGDSDADEGDEQPRRRRRRRGRRGGRGRRNRALEATFDHGETEGYGLWLDPAVKDNPLYAEHWAGHRPVRVAIEAERIVITRIEESESASDEPEPEPEPESEPES